MTVVTTKRTAAATIHARPVSFDAQTLPPVRMVQATSISQHLEAKSRRHTKARTRLAVASAKASEVAMTAAMKQSWE